MQELLKRLNESGVRFLLIGGQAMRMFLISKEAANRPQDQTDIEFLKELQRLGKL